MTRAIRRLALIAFSTAVLALSGAAMADQRTVVTLWSWSPDPTTMKAMVAAIEKAHPDIELRALVQPSSSYFTALQAAARSLILPDIIGLPPGARTQQYRERLKDLSAMATDAWGDDWQKHFAPVLLSEARLGNPKGDGSFYILPQEAEVLNLWYDREAFQKAKIAGAPKTFQDMATAARQLRAAGLVPFYQGAASDNFVAWVYMQIAAQTGLGDLVEAEGGAPVWTRPGLVNAAKVWRLLFTEHVFQPGALSAVQYPTGADLFVAGRVGMMSLGSWWLQETALSGQPQLTTMSGYGKFFFPALAPHGQPSPPLGGIDVAWGMTKNATGSPKAERAAETVLKELISGVGEQAALDQLNDLPAFDGMRPTHPPPHVQELYDEYIKELASAQPHVIADPTIFTALVSHLRAIGADKERPEQAMAAVQAVAEARLRLTRTSPLPSGLMH